MHQRKIQLIAGTTYTVSLPKNWVNMHNVSPKSSVFIDEREDGSLILFPNIKEKGADKESISINIDNQEDNITHILFASYYMGYENIRLFSKKHIQRETRNKVKRTIQNLSGVETVFEDLNKIDLKVLLDISKTNLNQLLFRTNLLISSCMDVIINRGDYNDLLHDEDEVDRLHHLITKMIFLSSRDAGVLKSSGITNISSILPYSAISTKLENIADSLTELGNYVLNQNVSKERTQKTHKILNFFRKRISRDVGLLLKSNMPDEHAKDMTEMGRVNDDISSIKDANLRLPLADIAKCIVHVEEELMNLTTYRKLMG
jgi:phosphate uptake regulator